MLYHLDVAGHDRRIPPLHRAHAPAAHAGEIVDLVELVGAERLVGTLHLAEELGEVRREGHRVLHDRDAPDDAGQPQLAEDVDRLLELGVARHREEQRRVGVGLAHEPVAHTRDDAEVRLHEQRIEHRSEPALVHVPRLRAGDRLEEHTSELQSLMRISYAVFCLKKKNIESKQKTDRKRTYCTELDQTMNNN